MDRAARDAESFSRQHMVTEKVNQRNITSRVLPRKYNVAPAKSTSDNVDATKLVKCPFCDGEHQLWHCSSFEEFDLEERTKVVKEHRLCFNCLKAGHGVAHCRLIGRSWSGSLLTHQELQSLPQTSRYAIA